MTRRLLALSTAGALVLPFAVRSAPAAAIDYAPYVTVDASPATGQAKAGEHFEAAEFSNTRPLSQGAVGSLPVFYADDQFGCVWTTAQASGIMEWIGLAERSVSTGSDPCSAFQQKLTAASVAGADALVVINNGPGTVVGTGAATIPGVIIDQTEGRRLRDSLVAGNPNAVKVTLGLLEPGTFLPPGAFRPTAVGSLQASVAGAAVSVGGSAVFGNQAPVTLGEDAAGDAPLVPDLGDDTGTDLLAGKVYQADPSDPMLTFEWHLTNLPATGAIPEGVRYLFPFKIGTKQYQLQAKFSNIASTTFSDDPQGHVTNAGASFQLRGNCAPDPNTGITNCPHIAWLTGQFNPTTDVVRINLPIGAPFAADVVPGAVLERNPVANGTIVAAYQAVVSNASTWDEAVWEDGVTYTVPTKQVMLGIAPAGTDPGAVSYTTSATLGANDSFTGTLSALGLAPGTYDVFARACFATNCGTTKASISI